jgi:hypothetical protein
VRLRKLSKPREPKHTVQRHWTFFWDTELSEKRMIEISEWIGSLSLEDRGKLTDLMKDHTEDINFQEF